MVWFEKPLNMQIYLNTSAREKKVVKMIDG